MGASRPRPTRRHPVVDSPLAPRHVVHPRPRLPGGRDPSRAVDRLVHGHPAPALRADGRAAHHDGLRRPSIAHAGLEHQARGPRADARAPALSRGHGPAERTGAVESHRHRVGHPSPRQGRPHARQRAHRAPRAARRSCRARHARRARHRGGRARARGADERRRSARRGLPSGEPGRPAARAHPGRARRRGPPLLRSRRRRPPRPPPRGVDEPPRRPRAPGRQHDHPAARQEPPAESAAHVRAQAQRGLALDRARVALSEAPHPRGVRQRDLPRPARGAGRARARGRRRVRTSARNRIRSRSRKRRSSPA